MSLRTFLVINSTVSFLLGIWFLVMAIHPAGEYTLAVTPSAAPLALTVGVLMVCFALASWMARDGGMVPAARGILWAIFLLHGESLFQGIYEIRHGLVDMPGALEAIGHFSTHLFLVVSALYYLSFYKEYKKQV